MVTRWGLLLILGSAAVTVASAQRVPLPSVPLNPPLGQVLGRVGDRAVDSVQSVARDATTLAADRIDRLQALVAHSHRALEMTHDGPVVRGEIVAVNADAPTLAAAAALGATVIRDEVIPELGLRTTSLRVPPGQSVDIALKRLRAAIPSASLTANHIYAPTGPRSDQRGGALAARGNVSDGVGIIDGGVGTNPNLTGAIEQRSFAGSALVASDHGTAVASLIAGTGAIRGAAPAAPLLVADVYGDAPTGGNAIAIARAIGWLVGRDTHVISMSLVGPPNLLLERAVAAGEAHGTTFVAAIGNDGPAAPPSYPASYPGVLAISAVDGRNRLLIENGNSLHIDFTAPGADMAAADLHGRWMDVRGTSFAVPLVAALAWKARKTAANPQPTLMSEAVAIRGAKMERGYGHGVLCEACRSNPKK